MKISATHTGNDYDRSIKNILDEHKDILIARKDNGTAIFMRYAEFLKNQCTFKEHNMTPYDYQEFTRYVDTPIELIDGKLFILPKPQKKHEKVMAHIKERLFNFFEGKDYVVMKPMSSLELNSKEESSIITPYTYVVSQQSKKPVLIIEMLSNKIRPKDLNLKLKLYAKSNVPEFWFVDPVLNIVFVYHTSNCMIENIIPYCFDEIIESVTFSGLRLAIKDFQSTMN